MVAQVECGYGKMNVGILIATYCFSGESSKSLACLWVFWPCLRHQPVSHFPFPTLTPLLWPLKPLQLPQHTRLCAFCLCAFVHAIPSTLLPFLLCCLANTCSPLMMSPSSEVISFLMLFWSGPRPPLYPQSHLASQHYCTLFSPLLSLEDRDSLLWSSVWHSGGAQ